MPYGMHLSAAGAHAQSQRLEVITHNLANLDTPGFKRELAIVQARHSAAILNGEDTPGTGTINQVGGGATLRETVTDFADGTMRRTGNRTDVAIAGEGYFMVEKEGQQFLTRAGDFHFDSLGRLVNSQGFSVLSQDASPIFVQPELPWEIMPHGEVRQGGGGVLLGLFKPRSLGDLARAGENLFRPLADVDDLVPTERHVMTEHLEMSGVKPTLEMMKLIETSRAYEANIKMIQNHDQVVGSLVGRILRE